MAALYIWRPSKQERTNRLTWVGFSFLCSKTGKELMINKIEDWIDYQVLVLSAPFAASARYTGGCKEDSVIVYIYTLSVLILRTMNFIPHVDPGDIHCP